MSTEKLPFQADFSPISGPDEAAEADFQRWRAQKLAGYPGLASDILVEIADPAALSPSERQEVSKRIAACNAAVVRLNPPSDEHQARADLLALGLSLGLENPDRNPYADEDAISPLAVASVAGEGDLGKSGRRLYIPYTNRRINWHTDGYYNPPERRILAMGLYCLRPAAKGGENRLLDPEMAYLLMREANPAWVRALAHPQAMTIPANEAADDVKRDAISGPVFLVNPEDGTMHMRYTARKKHIIWRDDTDTRGALDFLENLFERGLYTISHRMAPGEVLMCNNILHDRSPFEDSDGENNGRLLLRARYRSRISVSGE